jgi:pSer/pThr/pTyr-binding forkhead associated (FHA) protein
MADSAAPPAPSAVLAAETVEAVRALGGRNEIIITRFPFSIGRESRSPNPLKHLAIEVQRRIGITPATNDFYLMEPPSPGLLVSREHFSIEHVDGAFELVDRKSALGTFVSGTLVGGSRKGGRIKLKNGDTIVVGTASSPYVFTFRVQ